MTTATADRPLVTEAPSERRGLGARLASGLGKAPVHLLLIFVGLLWLVPTFGLFITSLMQPTDFQKEGWWNFLTKPGELTFDNYQAVFDNQAIMDSLWTTVLVAVGQAGDRVTQPLAVGADPDGAAEVDGAVVPRRDDPSVLGLGRVPARRDVGVRPGADEQAGRAVTDRAPVRVGLRHVGHHRVVRPHHR